MVVRLLAGMIVVASLASRAAAAPPPWERAAQDTAVHHPSTPDSLRSAQTDSIRNKAAAHDTVVAADTLGRMSTPSLVGTVDRALDSSKFVTRNDLNWIDHKYLGDILLTFPGTFIRDQVSPGQYNQISIRGVDWRSIAVSSNGRTLNDPASGVYNLFLFSTEYADRIEVITGPRAFLYGFGSAGGVVNILTKNYNSNKPFTKINYSEGLYNFGYSDGTFSQNISRKVNITFGYQHQGTDGEFRNSTDDAWNARAKIRYAPFTNLNLILSEYYTGTYTDLNGGIDLRRSGTANAFSPLSATVMNTDSYEKITRHDLDLSLVGTLLGDTVNVSTLSLYYSHSLREYRDEENRPGANGVFIQSDHVSSWMGTSFTQNLEAAFTRLTLGANLEIRQIEGSPNLGRRRSAVASAYGKDDLLLGKELTVSGYGRIDHFLGTPYLGLGADATLALTPSFALFGGTSVSTRPPDYQELYWTDSTVSRPSPVTAERHIVIEAGVRFMPAEGSTIHVAYFHRTIRTPILFLPLSPPPTVFPGVMIENGPTLDMNGLETKLGIRIWHLFLEGTATYLVQRSNGSTLDNYPHLAGSAGIYFWDRVLRGKLELKAGVRGQFRTRNQGETFNPEMIAYVPNTSIRLGVASSMDAFLIARIGDAYIHLMWENLTDVQYFSTPFYVAQDRGVRFGLSWEFLN